MEQVKEFIKKYCTSSGGKPYPINNNVDSTLKWAEELINKQKGLIDFFGGNNHFTFKVTLDKGQKKAPVTLIEPYMKAILNYIPNYFKEYDLTLEDFLLPNIEKCKNISASKHILTYAEKQKVMAHNMANINHYLATLGQYWNQYNNKEDVSFYITLSADPRAYMLIGSYGSCDVSSCFSGATKYNFSTLPDACIAFSHTKEKFEYTPNNPEFLGRALCIVDHKNKKLYISNARGNLVGKADTFKEIAQELFEEKTIGHDEGQFSYRGGVPYTDTCASQFFAGSKPTERREFTFEIAK